MIDSKDAYCVEPSNLHLTNEFIKVEQSDTKTSILYCVITWPHPHEPKETWNELKSFHAGTNDKEIEEAIINLTKDKRYFLSCEKCNQILPLGLMHNKDFCQGCSERYLGIIH